MAGEEILPCPGFRLFVEIKAGRFRSYTSEYVIRELEAATDTLREERLRLIKEYGVEVIPASDEAKCLAAATVKGLDFIVSLNFRHIVKRKTIEAAELINFQEGYKKIGIYSPAEVIDYAEDL